MQIDRLSRDLDKRHSVDWLGGTSEGGFHLEATGKQPLFQREVEMLPIGASKQSLMVKLYLFARSSRDKEEWYRRFVAAACGTPWPTHLSDLIQKLNVKTHHRSGSTSSLDRQQFKHRRCGSSDSVSSLISYESTEVTIDYGHLEPEQNLKDYIDYMAKIMPSIEQTISQSSSPVHSAKSSISSQPPTPQGTASLPCTPPGEMCQSQILWLNAIISRCFLDFLREKYWANKIREKIQKKLCKMHVCFIFIW